MTTKMANRRMLVKGFYREIILTLTLMLLVSALAVSTDLFNHLASWLKLHHAWEDGWVIVVLFAAVIINIMSWRALNLYRNEVKRRKDIEKEIKSRLKMEHTLTGISTRLMYSNNMDQTIVDCLGDLGTFTHADRGFLFIFTDDGKKVCNTHEWCAVGIPARIEELRDVDCKAITWSLETYKNGEILCINDVDVLPDDLAEKTILRKLQVKSILTIPIKVEGILKGFVGVSNVQRVRIWSEEDMVLFHVASITFSNVLHRWDSERALQQSHARLESYVEERTIELKITNQRLQQEIQEQRTLQTKLYQSEQRYKNLVELLPDAILIHTMNTILFVNQTAAQLIGYDNPADLVGRDILDFVLPEDVSVSKALIKNVVLERNTISLHEAKVLNRNQDTLDLELTSIPYIYANTPAALVVLHDITERKRTEELNQILYETIQYDALKTEFFSNISHELKTPLNLILGTVQLLDLVLKEQSPKDNGVESSKYIAIVKQNCYRLLRLVNNLIDITRMDAGFYKLNLRNCNIVSIVEDVCMSVVDYVNSKDIQLIFDTDIEEKITACDPDKLERVMLNLLSNAIKFTRSGGSIYINLYDCDDTVKVSVMDTGSGIPKEKVSTIFERFRQADRSLSRNAEGSGIGLSIVESLVKMHGGSIEVRSEEGRGSEFVLTLPVSQVAETEEVRANPNRHRSIVERIQIEFSDIYA